ncbi:hypothetical protein PG984_007334 [Apiospora sp. TS-2023a]
MRRRMVWLFGAPFDQFDTDTQIICLNLKLMFCAWVEIIFLLWTMDAYAFNFCVDVERKADLHMLMLSYVPGVFWMVIDRASRPFLRHYLPACGFPRFPPGSQDVLGLEGPFAEPAVEQPVIPGNV